MKWRQKVKFKQFKNEIEMWTLVKGPKWLFYLSSWIKIQLIHLRKF